MNDGDGDLFRLNRYLAMSGAGSRRNVENLVRSGRVSVNGTTVRDLSTRIRPGDDVRLDGLVVAPLSRYYLVMNKPVGVVCAVRDKFCPTVMDLVPEDALDAGVFPVGRLDKDSEGLLVLTNDGACAQGMIHPKNGIRKTYEVLLDREANPVDIESIRSGTIIGGKRIKPMHVGLVARKPERRWLSITLSEGVKREVRIMAASAGFRTLRLIRRKIGSLELRKIRPGESVKVNGDEIERMIFKGGTV
jgi:23S rRNA pseudouridine2605 synthase